MSRDRAAFERLLHELRMKTACRTTALVKLIREAHGGRDQRAPNQARSLIELAKAAELFHDPGDHRSYADLQINGHRETWPIKSKSFKEWLARSYFDDTGDTASPQTLQSVMDSLEARAEYEGATRKVFARIGVLDNTIYLDLGDQAWTAVEIDAKGWRVIKSPPVRFRRSAGMQPLPCPQKGGAIDQLRPFLNVRSTEDFVLAVAWLLACFRSSGPYPIMVLAGEQGSAKSTFSRLLRSVIDPNFAPLRSLPKTEQDLFIAAQHGHVMAFDNLSTLPASTSDALCRLATGGGYATRELYKDQDEVLFNAARPILMNGIEDVVARHDLADRALFLTLPHISQESRRTEAELWASFEAERPRILGALLDGVVRGLRELPHTQLLNLPRLADFAHWVAACEGALWPAGTFANAYCENRADAMVALIDSDPVAGAVRDLMQDRAVWEGTATELLHVLEAIAGPQTGKSRSWPTHPNLLSKTLRRPMTFLRNAGINIEFAKGKDKKRTRSIVISNSKFSAALEPTASVKISAAELPTPEAANDDTAIGVGSSNSARASR